MQVAAGMRLAFTDTHYTVLIQASSHHPRALHTHTMSTPDMHVKQPASQAEQQLTHAGQPASQSDKRTGSKDPSAPGMATSQQQSDEIATPAQESKPVGAGTAAAADKPAATTTAAEPVPVASKTAPGGGDEKQAAEDTTAEHNGAEADKEEKKEGEGEAEVDEDKPRQKVHLDIVDELDKEIAEKPEKDWGVVNPARQAEEEEAEGDGDDKRKRGGDDTTKSKKTKTDKDGDAKAAEGESIARLPVGNGLMLGKASRAPEARCRVGSSLMMELSLSLANTHITHR